MNQDRLMTKMAQMLVDFGYAGEHEEMNKEAEALQRRNSGMQKEAGYGGRMTEFLRQRAADR